MAYKCSQCGYNSEEAGLCPTCNIPMVEETVEEQQTHSEEQTQPQEPQTPPQQSSDDSEDNSETTPSVE
ncbi:hypothetical protein JW698_01765 [Candidatus Wolfebacteria bacterium]|nr:hypothetical protein [Candidatus Wolfebacteria bacterium]